MRILRMSASRTQRGVTLIELMIAITIGLVVIGSVLAFTVSTVRAYSENIRSSRLTQDLRTGMTLAVRELRRSGSDETAPHRALTATNPSAFTNLTATGECVTYQYDRGVGSLGGPAGATEIRGIRRNAATGTLQMAATGTSVSCNSASGWVDVSDAAVTNITVFTPTIRECRFCTRLASRTDPATGTTVYDIAQGSARNLSLRLTGTLRADTSIVRTIDDDVRVRAEDVSFITDSATDCPALQACTLP